MDGLPLFESELIVAPGKKIEFKQQRLVLREFGGIALTISPVPTAIGSPFLHRQRQSTSEPLEWVCWFEFARSFARQVLGTIDFERLDRSSWCQIDLVEIHPEN